MKIKVFIVTYNNDTALSNNIYSLRNSDLMNMDYEINIINNYGELNNRWGPNVKIINNTTRPDFSTGHLSRDWNTAIIKGFKNLNNPDCDIVVCCHNDTVFYNDWVSNLLELHKKYSFIQFGRGCGFMSFKPEAIKKIGLWDERFCNIGFHEGDYFLRAFLFNKEFTTLNDGWLSLDRHDDFLFRKKIYSGEITEIDQKLIHPTACNQWRILNPEENKIIDVRHSSAASNKEAHFKSMKYHGQSGMMFREKWGCSTPVINWYKFPDMKPKINIKSYILYPYFEKDIPKETLDSQNFVYYFEENYRIFMVGK